MLLMFKTSLESSILRAAAAIPNLLYLLQDTKQLRSKNVVVARISFPKKSSTHRSIVYLSAKSCHLRKSCKTFKVFRGINLLVKLYTQGLVHRAITSASEPTKDEIISLTMILSPELIENLQDSLRALPIESFCIDN